MQPAPTLDDILRLFQETDRKFQETDRIIKESQQETSRRFQETELMFQETDRKIQETDRIVKALSISQQETDREFQETKLMFQETKLMFQETDRKFQETDRKFQETDRKFQETNLLLKAQARETRRLEELFTSQWGKLMESLVEGDILAILNRFGVAVMDTSTRVKGHTASGQQFEFDIIAHNGDTTVVIEVKTTLRPKYVTQFIDRLDHFKAWLPRYANHTIYGAMAFLTADAGADAMAERLGLIVIRATGDSASIVNSAGFKPRGW